MDVDEINEADGEEGWGVFDSFGSIGGPWQIQRIDEEDRYQTDAEAWRHVWDRAEAGSEVHRAALDFVKAENPMEYRAIEHFLTTGEPLDQPPYVYA